MSYSDEELLNALRGLADQLGRPPTTTDMNERGEYSVGPYYERFGSWQQARAEAGVDSSELRGSGVSDDALLKEIRRLAEELDRVPSKQEMADKGNFSVSPYYEHFGSWRAAQEEAGFESNDPEVEASDDELLDEIRRLADELGRKPTADEMNEQGRHWRSTYQDHFGSWSLALEEAGFDPNPASEKITKEDVVAEIRRVADQLEKEPTYAEMNAHGGISASTCARRFESWSDARDAALGED